MTIKHHLIQYTALAALAAALVGCSSTKLDPATENAGNGAQSTVAPVDANGANGGNASGSDLSGPPASVGHVVYFDFDSFAIKPAYQNVIDQQARYLQSHSASHVTLEGNTDERGSREYNLALGQKRAEAVRRALTLVGAPDSQIEAVSFGSEQPAEQGHDEAAYSKNRRVEFRYGK